MSLKLPLYQELNLTSQNVLLRLDLNVPRQQGKIVSDARIQAALPTLQTCIAAGARLAIAAHLGRPSPGKSNREDSLLHVGEHLSGLLQQDIMFADSCIGDGVVGLLRQLRDGQVMMLENLRFFAGEQANDPDFARALAEPFQVYINDAFGAAHRAHASIVGVVPYMRQVAAGYLLQQEITTLSRLRQQPTAPFVAIIGGAKVSDKIALLQSLLNQVDTLCIGGAMAYTFLAAIDVEIGQSPIEKDKLLLCRTILDRAKSHGVKVLLPQDHIAASSFSASATPTLVAQPTLPANLLGLDIGPQTQNHFAATIAQAATVFWNGPMGVFEWPAFSHGTQAVAKALAICDGFTVVGGGDSIAALEQNDLTKAIDYISTGGGASLKFLELGTLPGIDALAQFKQGKAV